MFYLTQVPSYRNKDPKKWQGQNVFIRERERERGNCGKVTQLHREAKGEELFKQGLFAENSLSFIFWSFMIRMLLSFCVRKASSFWGFISYI